MIKIGRLVQDKISNFALREIREFWLRRFLDDQGMEMTRLGTTYGGCVLPSLAIRPGNTAVCVGAGEDISLDIDLNRLGLKVITVDPTPRAEAHVVGILSAYEHGNTMVTGTGDKYILSGFEPKRFQFVSCGIWKEDTTVRFFSPQDPVHVSHSIVNLQKTQDGFDAVCLRLATFCSSYGIAQIDILKLDVEGAEHEVLDDLVEQPIRPRILSVEFHGLFAREREWIKRIDTSIQKLRKSGYRFLSVDGANCCFALPGKTV